MYALRLTKASTAAACSSSSWERSAGGGEGGRVPTGRSAHMRSSSRRLCTESGGGAPGERIRRCRGPEECGARGADGYAPGRHVAKRSLHQGRTEWAEVRRVAKWPKADFDQGRTESAEARRVLKWPVALGDVFI